LNFLVSARGLIVFASAAAKAQIFKTSTDQNKKKQQKNHKPNTCIAAENYQI
jgi:hypothetical protein